MARLFHEAAGAFASWSRNYLILRVRGRRGGDSVAHLGTGDQILRRHIPSFRNERITASQNIDRAVIKAVALSIAMVALFGCGGLAFVDHEVSCQVGSNTYQPGDSFGADDGCNTCTCMNDGSVACTTMGCGATCTHNGDTYQPGDSFGAGDGCNTCTCMNDGTVNCTTMACVVTCPYDGNAYQPGDTFPAGNGCDNCTCQFDGEVQCTSMPCAGGCPEYTPLTTNPGPCQANGHECGYEGSVACGSCPNLAMCIDQRCYWPVGPEPSFKPPLMRSLYDEPEGTECLVDHNGALERVEAAIWNSGISNVVMEVYVICGSDSVLAATVILPGSAFPDYDGIWSEKKATNFELDPPLLVNENDIVTVLFHAEGASKPYKSAVTGIYTENVDSRCSFAPTSVLGISSTAELEFMARLHLHPQ